MHLFEQVYEQWITEQIKQEINPRRRELLQKGLGHGTVEFLRCIWFPAVGNLNHLYPEYEVRDYNNGYRYLDLAYIPGDAKGCIEIHGYSSHARDIDVRRFKDLCMKQALLALDDWLFLPIAYLSIKEDPGVCKQLILSFVGKFLAEAVPSDLTWSEAETLRFARRTLAPFTPKELAIHLQLSEQRTRVVLRSLLHKNRLAVASGHQRYRTYRLIAKE
ncbi:transcriptional regulator [Paenibacillus arenosi]|uniref:Transcriptional regulator n=1 Tax=Paenibacillus arenosi TaxID=2774142 RepID=A0ABR9B470_9BACL|nr:transcriptional regulator [Paenibacillus arenosi]MBD8501182.1 transcriptional regulator [Paenibacillus arenosi]